MERIHQSKEYEAGYPAVDEWRRRGGVARWVCRGLMGASLLCVAGCDSAATDPADIVPPADLQADMQEAVDDVQHHFDSFPGETDTAIRDHEDMPDWYGMT